MEPPLIGGFLFVNRQNLPGFFDCLGTTKICGLFILFYLNNPIFTRTVTVNVTETTRVITI